MKIKIVLGLPRYHLPLYFLKKKSINDTSLSPVWDCGAFIKKKKALLNNKSTFGVFDNQFFRNLTSPIFDNLRALLIKAIVSVVLPCKLT